MAQPASSASEQFSTIAVSFGKLVDHNRELCEKVFRSAQDESLRLLHRRIERNSHLLEAMRDSKNLTDMLAVQQEWLKESTQDYFDQMQKFGGLLWELGEGGMKNAADHTPSSSWMPTKGKDGKDDHRAAA